MANLKWNPFGKKKKGKIRPIFLDANSNYNNNEITVWLSGDHGVGSNTRGMEYLQARRAFLSSYQFSYEKKSLKEKLKKFGEGVEELAMEIYVRIRDEISKKRRVGVRVYRFTSTWPTSSVVRCFVPWVHDKYPTLGHPSSF